MEASNRLEEEVYDLLLCLVALGVGLDDMMQLFEKDSKMTRWADRIMERKKRML